MKHFKRISAGVYEFENAYGFKGEILKQPENGGWTIWDSAKQDTYDLYMSKGLAKAAAEDIVPPEVQDAQANMGDETLMKADPWAWLDK